MKFNSLIRQFKLFIVDNIIVLLWLISSDSLYYIFFLVDVKVYLQFGESLEQYNQTSVLQDDQNCAQ